MRNEWKAAFFFQRQISAVLLTDPHCTPLRVLYSDDTDFEPDSSGPYRNEHSSGADERTRLLPPSGISTNEYYDKPYPADSRRHRSRRSGGGGKASRYNWGPPEAFTQSTATARADNTTNMYMENQVRAISCYVISLSPCHGVLESVDFSYSLSMSPLSLGANGRGATTTTEEEKEEEKIKVQVPKATRV